MLVVPPCRVSCHVMALEGRKIFCAVSCAALMHDALLCAHQKEVVHGLQGRYAAEALCTRGP